MIKSIELIFIGNFLDGFNVSLRIYRHRLDSKENLATIETFRLEPEPKIPELYKDWKQLYIATAPNPMIGALPNQPINFAIAEAIRECKDRTRNLSECFKIWLGFRNFGSIREEIKPHISGATEIRVFLASNDKLLQRLPWHLLDLFDHPHIEVSLVPLKYSKSNLVRPPSNNNILAVFGADQGINLKGDLETMLALSNSNPPVFLTKPEVKTLQTQLGEGQWDILFFSGHSGTRLNGGVNEGVICINETRNLTIENLKNVLKDAIGKGLKLAIFNSCDGIALAEALLELKIPQVVVMRELVPNQVAEEFLKHFLKAFSGGRSLDLAVVHARRQLQGMETDFPCASWLPIIYQNPAEDSLTWKKTPISIWAKFLATFKKILATFKKILAKFLPMFILGVILAVLAATLNFYLISPPIDVSQRISYGEKFLIDNKFVTDDKKVPLRNSLSRDAFNPKDWDATISRFKNYLYGTDQKITSDTPLQKNDPESLIYLNNAIAEQNGNYATIAVSVPAVEDTKYLIDVSQEILRGVAQVQNEVNQGGEKQRINNAYFLKVVIAKDDNAPINKEDKKSDDRIVKAIAKNFVENKNFVRNEKILAVVGHNSTSASLAAADIYKDKLLAISPTSNGGVLDNKNNYYRTVPFVGRDAEVLNVYAKKKEWKKIGICFQKNDPSSESLKEAFAKKLNDSQIEAIDKFCDSLEGKNENDAKEIIRKFNIEEGVNALFLIPSIKTIPEALRIAKANYDSPKLPLIANATMYTSETINQDNKDNKDSVIGMVLVTVWHPEFDSTKSFADTSKNLWSGSTINWRTATSYDATKVIVEGLNKTNFSRESLIKFVADKPKVQTKTGIETKNTINFQPTGARDALIRLIKITKKDDGKLQFTPFLESASSNNKN